MNAETTAAELPVHAMAPGGACDGGSCVSDNDPWWDGEDDEEVGRYLIVEAA